MVGFRAHGPGEPDVVILDLVEGPVEGGNRVGHIQERPGQSIANVLLVGERRCVSVEHGA